MDGLLSALIAAVTALVVAFLTYVLGGRRDERARVAEESRDVNRKYLNPLRLSVVENYFRLQEIAETVKREGRCAPLTYVQEPATVRQQEDEWFNGYGAYLVSSCYLAACLFANLGRIRRELPFLRFTEADDTELLGRLRSVSLGYVRHLGVFYVTQDSLGAAIERDGKLLSYRYFCQLLQDDVEGPWFDRLLMYYIQTGEGKHADRVHELALALNELMTFIESAIGGTSSLRAVLDAEGHATQRDVQ